jgi:A/G-specific adenine glycosylase
VDGLRAGLLAWFARARRDLPWRRDRDPYRVWVSEAMLQQTRVEAVVPYYERFLARFPDVRALAAAPIDDVLAAWSGLGYYRRARALHAAARAVAERHGGAFPSTREALLALPGVGPYTAGAVASIAFDRPEPLVDGNVARVLARIAALDAPQESAEFRRAAWALAAALVPAQGAGDWNQALMELGATVCLPREPRCRECPVRERCRAQAEGRAAELPRPRRRPEPVDVELLVALVRSGPLVLVERRAPGARMEGLWELPAIEPAGLGRLYRSEWPRGARGEALIRLGDELGAVAHAITRHRIRARVFAGRWDGGAPTEPLRWVREGELEGLGLTGMARKVLRARCVRGAPR